MFLKNKHPSRGDLARMRYAGTLQAVRLEIGITDLNKIRYPEVPWEELDIEAKRIAATITTITYGSTGYER